MNATVTKGFNEKKQRDIFIIDFDDKLSNGQLKELANNGVYWSPFLKRFISYKELTSERVLQFLSGSKSSKKETKKSDKVEYKKSLFDYMTLAQYKDFIINYYNEDFKRLPSYYKFRNETIQEGINSFLNETIQNIEHLHNKYGDEHFKLQYIREAIIHKSLGFDAVDFAHYNANGDGLRYLAIWDLLPVIEGLEINKNVAYTASWGYDQTNIDIAHELNKRVWGFDVVIVKTNHNAVMFVRIKRDEKEYFAFHDDVRYFRKDNTPEITFQQDASVTGYYR